MVVFHCRIDLKWILKSFCLLLYRIIMWYYWRNWANPRWRWLCGIWMQDSVFLSPSQNMSNRRSIHETYQLDSSSCSELWRVSITCRLLHPTGLTWSTLTGHGNLHHLITLQYILKVKQVIFVEGECIKTICMVKLLYGGHSWQYLCKETCI